jgi:hypothetical protein
MEKKMPKKTVKTEKKVKTAKTVKPVKSLQFEKKAKSPASFPANIKIVDDMSHEEVVAFLSKLHTQSCGLDEFLYCMGFKDCGRPFENMEISKPDLGIASPLDGWKPYYAFEFRRKKNPNKFMVNVAIVVVETDRNSPYLKHKAYFDEFFKKYNKTKEIVRLFYASFSNIHFPTNRHLH